MSKSPKFRIQPRDVCPSDHLKYLESKYINYSNHALTLVNNLQNLMSQYKNKKEINALVQDNIDELAKRHKNAEEQYDQTQKSFFNLQKKIFLLSNSVGRNTQKRKLISARNKKINEELNVDNIKNRIEEINAKTIDNKSKSENINKVLDEQKKKLDEIRKKYFSDYKDDNYYFNSVKAELQKRRLDNDKLLKEIDQNNRRLFADSLNRTNLMKL